MTITTLSRAEWLDARCNVLTGTDIAAVAGMSPYKTALDVYMDKLGLTEEQPETEAMAMGKRLEPVVIDLYEERTGWHTTPGHFLTHPSLPWAGGTPDALCVHEDGPLVEAKTAGSRMAREWGEPGTDQVPTQYLLQVSWYLALTNRQAADIALLLGGQEFRVYHIARNMHLEARLLEIGEDFWRRHIVPGIAPEPSSAESAERYVRAAFPRDTRPELLPADEASEMRALRLHEARQRLAEAESVAQLLEAQIKADIGESAGLQGRLWRATWKKTKGSEVIDWPALALSLAGDIDSLRAAKKRFMTTRPGSRRFLFTFDNGEGK